ncbi:MAG: ASCH domain-containing protein [Candidatus Moraniibacteriota bacterium]|jgi:hypothetical protein
MKTLKFRQKLSELILVNKKTTTWRLFDNKNLSVDDEVVFVIWEDGQEFARIKILETNEVKFCDLTENDWEGHERYDSDEEMYQTFEKYYNCKVDKNSPVKIIKFEIL